MLLGGEELPGTERSLHGEAFLKDFSLRMGLPVWHYAGGRFRARKTRRAAARAEHGADLLSAAVRAGQLRLRLRPAFHFRGHDDSVGAPLEQPYQVTGCGDQFEVLHGAAAAAADAADCRTRGAGARRRPHARSVIIAWRPAAATTRAACSGVPAIFGPTCRPARKPCWSPRPKIGKSSAPCRPSWRFNSELDRRARLSSQADAAAAHGAGAELVLAADQFIIRPETRAADAARAHATGDEIRTVIAGYHWFTDWGRDTMISLEGLTLCTGRHTEAGWILRTFANYVRDGLIPNLFPEGESEGLYHTADASLWFFHALDRYVQATGDRATLRYILPKLEEIISHHFRGTRFGIGVDPADGLLKQGAAGLSAHLDGRQGRRLGGHAAARQGRGDLRPVVQRAAASTRAGCAKSSTTPGRADEIAEHARTRRESFNRRFWYEKGNYLYDVVDGETGDDTSLRPNQVFAISLAHPVLDEQRWKPVLDVVTERLLTPVGLAVAGARASPTTSRATTAICVRATPPITRARSGPG